MSAASSSMPHPGSARLTLRALSIWPNEDGPAQRLQIPSSADEDTNTCTTSLSMRRSDCNRNPWRTQPGKPSSASSMDRRPWPGSGKIGPMLWQFTGSRKNYIKRAILLTLISNHAHRRTLTEVATCPQRSGRSRKPRDDRECCAARRRARSKFGKMKPGPTTSSQFFQTIASRGVILPTRNG